MPGGSLLQKDPGHFPFLYPYMLYKGRAFSNMGTALPNVAPDFPSAAPLAGHARRHTSPFLSDILLWTVLSPISLSTALFKLP